MTDVFFCPKLLKLVLGHLRHVVFENWKKRELQMKSSSTLERKQKQLFQFKRIGCLYDPDPSSVNIVCSKKTEVCYVAETVTE